MTKLVISFYDEAGTLQTINLELAKGDIIYFDGTKLARLPIGTSGQTLKASAGGLPEWVTVT